MWSNSAVPSPPRPPFYSVWSWSSELRCPTWAVQCTYAGIRMGLEGRMTPSLCFEVLYYYVTCWIGCAALHIRIMQTTCSPTVFFWACVFVFDRWFMRFFFLNLLGVWLKGRCFMLADEWKCKEFGYSGSGAWLHLSGMKILGTYNEVTSCGGRLLNGQRWGRNICCTKLFVVKYLQNTGAK